MEEYYRCERIKDFQNQELQKIPKGCLVEKKINGKTYHYIQWHEGKKIKTKYVRNDDVKVYKVLFRKKQRLQTSIKSLDKDMKIIKRALGMKFINEYKEEFSNRLSQS